MRRGPRGGLSGLWRDSRGASTVEMAFALPVFLLFLFGTIELGIVGMVSANFNVAVESISRRLRTGQDDRPPSVDEFRKAVCARMADSACPSRLKLTVQAVGAQQGFSAIQSLVATQDPANVTGNEAFTTGGPTDIMLVTATYTWPLFIPPLFGDAFADQDGNVLMVTRLVFKNEPWQP